MLLLHDQRLTFWEQTVENEIRLLRAELGWSQSELARHLAVSRQTVNAIENGRYDPSLPLAFKIARAFDRPIEAVFTDDKSPKKNPTQSGDTDE